MAHRIYPRYLHTAIKEDLAAKMVFLGGPRQVGKTTLGLSFLENGTENHPAYLNWDNPQVRNALLKGELPSRQPLLIFDEIHKYSRWRNLVKGFYDTHKSHTSFLITGSARLDYYRKGGDSLQGRYHYHRLHPFSLNELNSTPNREDIEGLLQYGGFPEPLLAASERTWRRWHRERLSRIIYDDIRDLENVKEISLLELLIEELPRRVGSPLSIKNLKDTLQVAHDTVEHWIDIFERMYVCFRISPYGSPKIRAVKKERKLYLIDWSQVDTEGERFENMVACQLLKYCHFLEDTEGYAMELRFIRDTDKREIDFVVMKEKKPLFAVECKSGEKTPAPAHRYFRERTAIPRFYQVHRGHADYGNAETSVRVLPFTRFCSELEMP
jgi:predicted AAA+ superfamily ATPase